MRKRTPKPYCNLSLTNSVSQSNMVDIKIHPLVLELEKKLKKIAQEERLHIDGLIWIWSIK